MNIGKYSKYLDDVTSYQYYQILRFSVTLLISIILVKSDLPLQDIALFELILFLSNAISFFWGNGLKNGLLIYYPTLQKSGQDRIIFSVFVLLTVCSFSVCALFFALQDFILAAFVSYDVPYVPLLLFYTVLVVPSSLAESYYVVTKENSGLIRYANFICLSKLLIIVTSLVLSHSLEYLLYGMILWAFISFLWMLNLLLKLKQYRFDWALTVGLLTLSLPLVFQVLVGSGIEFVDGFIISKFYDEQSFLIYRYGARELPFIVLIISAMKSVMINKSVGNIENVLDEIKQRTSRYMNWMFPLTILVILISPIIIPFVYSAEFKDSAYLLNIYALVISSRIMLPQVVLYSHHKTRVLFWITMVELVLNVSLSLFLMQYFDLFGIAFATVIAYLAAKVTMMAYNKWAYDISFSKYIDWPRHILFTCATIVAFIISLQY